MIYFYGTGIPTKDRAVYVMVYEGFYFLSHFEMSDGDGTVTVRSATNDRNHNTFRIPMGGHTYIIQNIDALNDGSVFRF